MGGRELDLDGHEPLLVSPSLDRLCVQNTLKAREIGGSCLTFQGHAFVMLTQEEEAFRLHALKIEAERDQALFVCHLQYGPQAKVACQELCRASADFQFLSRHFLDCQYKSPLLQQSPAPSPATKREDPAETRWQLLGAYR